VLWFVNSVTYFFDGITGWTGFLESCLSLRKVPDLSLYLHFPFSEIQDKAYPAFRGVATR